MKRQEGWEIRLDEFLNKRKTAPFVWGINDCCIFAADTVQILNTINPASGFKKKYSTQKQAYKLLNEYLNLFSKDRVGKGSLILNVARTISKQNGFLEVLPAFAKRGDVAAVETGLGVGLGVVDLSGLNIVTPGEKGLVSFPLTSALCAWNI